MSDSKQNNLSRRDFVKTTGLGLSTLGITARYAGGQDAPKRPNIVWICVEDMSAHMSCYGETTIQTPTIDRLAQEGTKFTQAVVTCPVCSPSRSAMITGMYQTTTGTHNHRSSRHDVKIRLPEHVKPVPRYFQEAGYYTSNTNMLSTNPNKKSPRGKTDYNFVFDGDMYDDTDWRGREPGQPFFAQFQLRGGKNRGAEVENPVNPDEVELPPYYPDNPVLRRDWAKYLNSVLHVDHEVSVILNALEEEGELDNTIIFFWTDHGISHVRDKQFVYEGGARVPLIVWGPGVPQGKVKEDLVEHIDIPVTSMQMAGIEVPDHMQGRPLFDDLLSPRGYVISGRDRCDETVDRIRCVRTQRFKYIRNYFPNRSHMQPNRYKNGKEIVQTMRDMYENGELNEVQAKPFHPTRPKEELYDLQNDPYELHNLVENEDSQVILEELRDQLIEWERDTGDLGQIAEPCLNDLYRNYGSMYAILQDPKNRKMVDELRRVWGKGDQGQEAVSFLKEKLNDDRPTIRYQAAMEFAKMGDKAQAAEEQLMNALEDDHAIVRTAAARAVSTMGMVDEARSVLVNEMQSADNEAVRHYAAAGLEDMGGAARPALDVLKEARDDPYEYVQRVSTRIVNKLTS